MTTATHPSVTRDQLAWIAASISDGGGHYGTVDRHGRVVAVCGARFEAQRHPCDPGAVSRWGKPTDEAHACPACRRIRPASADPAHEWQELVVVE